LTPWVQGAIPLLHRVAPDVSQILHVGDFGYWPGRDRKGFLAGVDSWAKTAGITSILVTPGNHEHWDRLNTSFAASPDEPVQISEAMTTFNDQFSTSPRRDHPSSRHEKWAGQPVTDCHDPFRELK